MAEEFAALARWKPQVTSEHSGPKYSKIPSCRPAPKTTKSSNASRGAIWLDSPVPRHVRVRLEKK
eukprot:6733594-Pyramimonas_sp.AAC.1